MRGYFSRNHKRITYPVDTARSRGLRNAQLGAIHAIASFFTLNQSQAAITVMPTGAGKTAVLMMAPYVITKDKVLVVTPSVMVRGQIAEDFQSLTTLCKANVFKESMAKPRVYEMFHKFSEECLPEMEKADVIVATPQCALSLSETEWAVKNITLVEIDEAHHTPAKTWQQILINLGTATHVLFTATPFRLDRKEISGEIVYDYPLSLAYADGIFGEIQYVPVQDGDNKDVEIARKAEEVLLSDRDAGFNHFLMVRTDKKSSAEALENIYQNNTRLHLQRVDSSMSNKQIKQFIQELKSGNLDGIICVDMLGEGFDFPNLKIAAIHVPHKSMASTLQFIGRFARTNAPDIGTAKFIASNNEELEIENNRLYAEDAVWQDMIINMSEGKNQKEQKDRQYYKSYEVSVASNDEDRISLQSIMVNCHDRIYRVRDFDINADFPETFNIGGRVYRSKEDETVIGIGLNYVAPLWMSGDNKINKEYSLYIVHFQKDLGLLHIYSQSHTEATYEEIVKVFCEEYDKIPKSEMNRVLGNLTNFEIFNSGMVNRYSESGEAYRIMAGSDVSDSIDRSTGKMYSAGHVFCKATAKASEGQESITIGYSSASKVWSSTYKNLPDYIGWVDEIGKKIVNSSIVVKTNTNYDYIPMPERLVSYPESIFFGDFNEDTYSSPPYVQSQSKQDVGARLSDFSIVIDRVERQKITFKLVYENLEEKFCCDLQGRYTQNSGDLYTHIGPNKCSLSEYLSDHPISFKTFDDKLISGFEIYRGAPDADVFDQSIITGIDWKRYGTDTSIEFCKEINTGVISIQDTLKEILMKDPANKYILYDHGSGEMADYIAIREDENRIIVRFYHVKKKSSKEFNSSLGDVYEVAGQAVKSIIWLTTKGRFIEKIRSRHSANHCQLINGDYNLFIKEILKSTKQLTGFIVIVQPGLSKSALMPDKIQEVLAAASSYISRAGKVQGLEILGSE